MEYSGRRHRRGRERRARQSFAPQSIIVPNSQKRSSIMDGFSSFLIMTTLLAIIYLMLDYHCTVCPNNKCDFTNITKNIDDIADNISTMKESYSDLEIKVVNFSHELQKIEGQIDILESLASTIGCGDFQRPGEDISLPKADHCPQRLKHEGKLHEADTKNFTNSFPKKNIKFEQD